MKASKKQGKQQARGRSLHPVVGRRKFFDWLMRVAGVEMGQRIPLWAIPIMLVLFPSRIPMWIGLPFYDSCTDCIKIGGIKLPLHALLDTYRNPSPPGYWFRIVGKTEWGTPIIECRTDGYTVDSPSNPNFQAGGTL